MKKNYLVSLSCLFLIFSLLLVGCGTDQSDLTPTPFPTSVKKTYSVQRGDIVINVELFGRVTPLALASAYFQMDGHVGDVYVQVNDAVKKGQLLADLVELKTLQAQTVEISDSIKRAQIALQIAQLTLEKYKAGGASGFDIQIQEKQVELAQMDLDEVLIKYGIDPSTDALDALDASVNKAKVFAPVEGVIISGVNPGRAVATTTVAFTIGDGTQSEILASVDPGTSDETIKNMFEGMPVVVTPNSQPNLQWSGKIHQLPSPYGTGSSEDKNIHIVLDQIPSAGDLKFGDTVTVLVQQSNKIGILWLPPAAIREVGGRTFVIINGTNGPKRLDIDAGLKTADKVEIISGLEEGQVVIGQ
jgi:multidrug efflux pump subunit AcrA (membrane-fusion protein)